jgi:hypothetical protein
MKHTLPPPVPSTIFPLRLSTTLACNSPPRILSSTLPNAPQTVTARTHCTLLTTPDASPEQKGMRMADVTAMLNAPSTPANNPVAETPPFVPGGTTRRVGDVISRGCDLERIPSSEENVSAATAA